MLYSNKITKKTLNRINECPQTGSSASVAVWNQTKTKYWILSSFIYELFLLYPCVLSCAWQPSCEFLPGNGDYKGMANVSNIAVWKRSRLITDHSETSDNKTTLRRLVSINTVIRDRGGLLFLRSTFHRFLRTHVFDDAPPSTEMMLIG